MITSPNQLLLKGNTSIQESLRALLRSTQFSPKIGTCVGCGVIAEFEKLTMVLWGSDEKTEVTLPVCRKCASSTGSGRTDDGSAVSPMTNLAWEQFYKSAVVEVDGQKVPDRISSASDAITARLQELEGDSDHHDERGRLEHALKVLKLLTTETQTKR